MNVVLIEDEKSASKLMVDSLAKIDKDIQVTKILDSVKSSVHYFKNNHDTVDLILMDVHLGDGISFEVFEKIEIDIPIIFVTAYDEYAIKAFEHNSIYYLLKPIKTDELQKALLKHKKTENHHQLFKQNSPQARKIISRFLIYSRSGFLPMKCDMFSFFYIEENIVRGVTNTNIHYVIDKKMSELEEELDPELFFRVSRQVIVNRNAVTKIHHSFYGKTKIDTHPKHQEPITLSKAKNSIFKKWLIY